MQEAATNAPTSDPTREPAPVLAPELARAALAFLERATLQGRREAQTYLHLCSVLEEIANVVR